MTSDNIKSKLLFSITLVPLAVAIILLFKPLNQTDGTSVGVDTLQDKTEESAAIEGERLIFLLQYISADYGGAVQEQKVVNQTEYAELLDFSGTAIDWYVNLRPDIETSQNLLRLQKFREAVQRKEKWSSVSTLSSELSKQLAAEFNIIRYPASTPDQMEGKYYYGIACAQCHGANGDGRGRSAKQQDPSPTNFQDSAFMNKTTPNQFFNAMTFGVENTAMPSFQEAFNEQQRWDIAFYLTTLRGDFAPKKPPAHMAVSIQDLSAHSNEDLLAMLKTDGNLKVTSALDDSVLAGWVDYLRLSPPETTPQEHLLIAQKKLSKSLSAYMDRKPQQALSLSINAYLDGFDPVEPLLLGKNKSLVTRVESKFSRYCDAIRTGQTVAVVRQRYQSLNETLSGLSDDLEPSRAQWQFALLQSTAIIVREGIEAALLIALMITSLVSAGYDHLRKYVVSGVALGLAAGIVLWLISEVFFAISPLEQETMEGFASLLAAAVLFSVSFWIIHKVDLEHWKSYIRSKAVQAIGTGSGFALAFAAFLAVFREAFETVLFYEVLWLKSTGAQSAVIAGFILGAIALSIVVVVIFKIGLKFPLKPFFTVTGVLLGLLAFVFTGYGVRELQNAGLLGETVFSWDIRVSWLEIHPTLEGFLLQSGILLSFLLGWFSVLFQKFNMTKRAQSAAPSNERLSGAGIRKSEIDCASE